MPTESLLIDACGCVVEQPYEYEAITQYIIDQYELANMPQPTRIYKAWDYAFKMRKSLDYTVTDADVSVIEVDGITVLGHTRVVKAIYDGTQVYIKSQFTQDGNEITMTNGATFFDGQLLTLEFEYE